jgi:hypothetical protein
MTLDDHLHDTFSSAVAGLEHPDRWQEVVTRGRRRRRQRRIAVVGSAAIALAAAVGLAVALAGGPTTTQVKIAPAHGSVAAPTAPPSTARPGPTTTQVKIAPAHGSSAAPTAPPSTARPAPTTATPHAPAASSSPAKANSPASAAPAPYSFRYLPLYPFATQAQAVSWLRAYQTSGVQPWHQDPGATALAFAAFLGYTDINKVTGSNITATQAHISVGYQITPSQPHTAAVIHLVRYGPTPTAPWEVVGTDDTPGFTITSPAYGAAVRSPIVAGGRITGVDESITVQVWTLSSPTSVGRTCCHPAGGNQRPWTVTVPFNATPGQVLIVSAATGGHVAAVERFVVTGVRD